MSVQDLGSKIIVTHPNDSNTSITILKYGCTILSCKLKGEEQLWLSDAARLDGSRPVRGGIPLVFPVFDWNKTDPLLSKLPQHGLVRSCNWEFLGKVDGTAATVQFGLNPKIAEPLTKLWPGQYKLVLTIELELDHFKTEIQVENTSNSEPLEFNWLFHTYLRLNDLDNTTVANLKGAHVRDILTETHFVDENPVIRIHKETYDSYEKVDTKSIVQVIDGETEIHSLERENLPDIVVWHPWTEKPTKIDDFEPKSGYKNMICIQAGHVTDLVTLKPGQKWIASQTLGK